ncbi:SDR family NAD(P)-dependent oxidoreductase [Actinophytocola sp.]|uniref:SDR family NAD(P)-dependent oxidoreductase n=1 Tax=Actinophytocola sp. TaxID=1872138 RepID=UPI00389B1BA2
MTRTVVISGASSGIGRATAERFAAAGDRVVNLDLRPPEPDTGESGWIRCDTTDWAQVESVLDDVHHRTGRLDVVIANAGVSIRHAVLDITRAEASRVLEVNLLGVLGLWRAAASVMVERRSGVLLATASTNGSVGYPYYADYNASKAGVLALCRSFALELSPYVRVACVSPGYVLTPMQRAEYTDEMLAEVDRGIPIGRHAAPKEIAEAFFFLASDGAGYITGQQLVVDGGELAGGVASRFGTTWARQNDAALTRPSG